MKKRDPLKHLVAQALRHRFDRIPDRVRALAKIHMIDGVAAMVAGMAMPAVRGFQQHLFGSGADATAGFGHFQTPSLAAFANSFSASSSIFDDVQTTEFAVYGLLAHPTSPSLAAALAVAQARKATGPALIEAYLVGAEATAQLA